MSKTHDIPVEGYKVTKQAGYTTYEIMDVTMAGPTPTQAELTAAIGAASLFEDGTEYRVRKTTTNDVYKVSVENDAWYYEALPTVAP